VRYFFYLASVPVRLSKSVDAELAGREAGRRAAL
jgi:hypothetical protein